MPTLQRYQEVEFEMLGLQTITLPFRFDIGKVGNADPSRCS